MILCCCFVMISNLDFSSFAHILKFLLDYVDFFVFYLIFIYLNMFLIENKKAKTKKVYFIINSKFIDKIE